MKNKFIEQRKTAIILMCLFMAFVIIFGFIGYRPKFMQSPTTKLDRAIDSQDIGAVEEAIKSGADLNPWCAWGDTLLNDAIKTGNLEIVKILIDNGAYVEGQGNCVTPLSTAIVSNNENVVDFLISKGANVNNNARENDVFNYPIIMAAHLNEPSILEKLIKAGADVNIKDSNNETALIIAAESGHKNIVEILLTYHADINTQTKGCWNAVDRAILENKGEVVEILKAKGAKSHDVATLTNFTKLYSMNWNICQVGLQS